MKTRQQTLPSTVRSLSTVVTLVWDEIPSTKRGDVRVICDAVKDHATAKEWLAWGEQALVHGVRALVHGVRAALRQRDADGLPKAVNINGKYIDGTQLEFPEFVMAAYDMARRGQQMYDRARALQRLCEERTGRSFDVEDVIHAASHGEPVEDVLERLSA